MSPRVHYEKERRFLPLATIIFLEFVLGLVGILVLVLSFLVSFLVELAELGHHAVLIFTDSVGFPI